MNSIPFAQTVTPNSDSLLSSYQYYYISLMQLLVNGIFQLLLLFVCLQAIW